MGETNQERRERLGISDDAYREGDIIEERSDGSYSMRKNPDFEYDDDKREGLHAAATYDTGYHEQRPTLLFAPLVDRQRGADSSTAGDHDGLTLAIAANNHRLDEAVGV